MKDHLLTEPFIQKVKQAIQHLYVWSEIEQLQAKEQILAYFTNEYENTIANGFECRFSIWFYQTIRKGVAAYIATQINIP